MEASFRIQIPFPLISLNRGGVPEECMFPDAYILTSVQGNIRIGWEKLWNCATLSLLQMDYRTLSGKYWK